MACDMAICSDDTTFGIPEIKFGQGSCFPILPYSMTLRKARELILTGENYDSKTALEYGVVNYSVPMEELDAKVMELAKKLALVPTPALKLQKRCINRLWRIWALVIRWSSGWTFCAWEFCGRMKRWIISIKRLPRWA